MYIFRFIGTAAILLFLLPGISEGQTRQILSLNDNWKFTREDPADGRNLVYDIRPPVHSTNDNIVADSRPNQEAVAGSTDSVLKKWILPTANDFIKDPAGKHIRPAGNPGLDVSYTQSDFNDSPWATVQLPHDWAIEGPFYKGDPAKVGGGMGRLPVQGVGWYRKKINIPAADKGKKFYLDIDGAMSYAMVWINGYLAGGWPYGYNSFRIDLSPYIRVGAANQLAIRIDNPNYSARWYPGAGLYRNVWLVKTNPVHIAQWGSFVQTNNVSTQSANIRLDVRVENKSIINKKIEVVTDLFLLNTHTDKPDHKVASFPRTVVNIGAGRTVRAQSQMELKNPKLWQPLPSEQAHRYLAITRLFDNGKLIDRYETPFGIRDIQFDPVRGLLVNNQPVRIQGVNQHHDLGALGAAFNIRAAERQLELLKEMGCNAIRMAHNPPAPELLHLTDRMGFLVINEIFDCWEKGKTPHDFHLIFKDWYEADIRAFIRRDRNHPSVIAWSFGNEVGEQYTAEAGAAMAKKLHDICREEDPTRPTTASMNFAKPNMPFPQMMDIISLNYQGEGIRDAPAYSHLKGIRTSPMYPAFHKRFPEKMIISSETASALSTRGSYIFPVTNDTSAPVSDSTGGDPARQQVSAYELYTAQFGASPDKVFASQDQHPFVAGEFVWTGWDYLGEPTPYYSARSSYSGIIDVAGFKKDRFYLYQSRWKPQLPIVHILPHWNWPDRTGKITPVHIFTSGDEAELFLNGQSLGRKKKNKFEYRLRWDEVVYEPGILQAVAYKEGKRWATATVQTTRQPAALQLCADRQVIQANGKDLSFITVNVADENGNTVPDAHPAIRFSLEGSGEIAATDNGDPADLVSFQSPDRNAYFGKALLIVRSIKGRTGPVKITASAEGLPPGSITIWAK